MTKRKTKFYTSYFSFHFLFFLVAPFCQSLVLAGVWNMRSRWDKYVWLPISPAVLKSFFSFAKAVLKPGHHLPLIFRR
uniref:Uncharacterized protein n=1 Tax=Arundo donax TaxID=35708 RepID=A0A0A9K1W7_ARUDO